jgi:hypothetical protein
MAQVYVPDNPLEREQRRQGTSVSSPSVHTRRRVYPRRRLGEVPSSKIQRKSRTFSPRSRSFLEHFSAILQGERITERTVSVPRHSDHFGSLLCLRKQYSHAVNSIG